MLVLSISFLTVTEIVLQTQHLQMQHFHVHTNPRIKRFVDAIVLYLLIPLNLLIIHNRNFIPFFVPLTTWNVIQLLFLSRLCQLVTEHRVPPPPNVLCGELDPQLTKHGVVNSAFIRGSRQGKRIPVDSAHLPVFQGLREGG